MKYSVSFKLGGQYRKAHLAEGKEMENVDAGSIIVGRSFDQEGRMEGSAEVVAALSECLMQLMACGDLPMRASLGGLVVRITLAEDFVFDNAVLEGPTMKERVFWDFIDQEMK